MTGVQVMCFNIPDTAVAQYSVGWEGLGWRFRLPNGTVVPIEVRQAGGREGGGGGW